MKKNVFLILIDGCEFSVFENEKFSRKIAPNINSLIKNGILKKIVTNGMITQVSMPSIFTQTYPLDYKGYNFGIKYRPKSIVELFKEKGYKTTFIAGHNITGPTRKYERGATLVKSIYDFTHDLEQYIRLILYHEIKKFDQNEISKKDIINILQNDFHDVLNYTIKQTDRVDYFFMPKKLRKLDHNTINKIKKELIILKKDPLQILEKLKKIPSRFYIDFLGMDQYDLVRVNFAKKLKIKSKLYYFKTLTNVWFKKITKLGLSPFPLYLSPISSEIINEARKFLLNLKNEPWFIFMQLMDNHDGPKTSRYLNFIEKLRFVPFLYKLRKKHPTHRNFWRDLSLHYLDRQLGHLVKDLKKMKKFENTIFYFFGDHGMGWDPKREISNSQNLGFRTFFEHIEVPLIISPCDLRPSTQGIHDGMSISATLVRDLKLKKNKSFKGKTIFESGKEASIVESVGRGNCDLLRRDIYFTVTSKNYKIMFILEKNKLFPVMLFDKKNDPHEYKNLLKFKINKSVINDLACFLVKERKEILLTRKVDIKSIINKKYKWIINFDFIEKSYKPSQSYNSE